MPSVESNPERKPGSASLCENRGTKWVGSRNCRSWPRRAEALIDFGICWQARGREEQSSFTFDDGFPLDPSVVKRPPPAHDRRNEATLHWAKHYLSCISQFLLLLNSQMLHRPTINHSMAHRRFRNRQIQSDVVHLLRHDLDAGLRASCAICITEVPEPLSAHVIDPKH